MKDRTSKLFYHWDWFGGSQRFLEEPVIPEIGAFIVLV